MIESDRLIAASRHTDEERQDRAIRPKRLADYVGQKELRSQM
jgi:holliday junction DNA helicase RuvB